MALSHSDVGEILTLANRALAADINDGRFVTLLLGRLEPTKRRLVFASAGHPPGYVLSSDGAVKFVMESAHLPLGVLEEQQFATSAPLELKPGDAVVLLTDGIAEAANGAGQFFGQDRALDVVRRNLDRSARQIVTAIGEQVRSHSDRATPQDDLTAVVVKVEAVQPAAIDHTRRPVPAGDPR